MPGAKIPVLESERFDITRDGRGIIIPWDADNLHVLTANAVAPCSGGCNGWLRIRYVSGSTYGPTGSTMYVPLYSTIFS